MGRVFVGVALLALLGSSSGCGLQADWEARAFGLAQEGAEPTPFETPTSEPVPSGTPQGKAAFVSNVLPILRAKCSSCHGATQLPLFAISDPTLAYAAVLAPPLVDFNGPADESHLVKKSSDDHCGMMTCHGRDDSLIAGVEAWSAEERAAR